MSHADQLRLFILGVIAVWPLLDMALGEASYGGAR